MTRSDLSSAPARPLGFLVVRVPAITAFFWITKALSTALGESTSDFLVQAMDPVVAVLLGFAGFVVSIVLQFAMRRYVAWAYWLAVAMVGIFGTMAADVVHVAFGVPYLASTMVYGVLLAGVYVLWQRVEGTLSIHSITTARREAFYWLAVVATFATGTAAGDLSAMTLRLGYARSIVLFAVAILVPVVGYRFLRWNSIFCFWFAYVLTRPLGASVADWLGKPVGDGGMGFGSGAVSLVLALLILGSVGYLSLTRKDVQDHAD